MRVRQEAKVRVRVRAGIRLGSWSASGGGVGVRQKPAVRAGPGLGWAGASLSLLPLQWKPSHLAQDAGAPGLPLVPEGPQGLDLQFPLPPQQPQCVGSQGLGGQSAKPAPQLPVRPYPPAGLVFKRLATSPFPPYGRLTEATCVELDLGSFRLAGATRSAGMSSGGSRGLLTASPPTGDGRASSLASPASGQDSGAIFDVLGGAEWVGGVCPV